MSKKFNIWEGVFSSFADARAEIAGLGFNGDVYRTRATSVARECLAALRSGKPIPTFHKQRSTLLPPVAAMMVEQDRPLRILDFGGGLGIGYMVLSESIIDVGNVQYTIVEVPGICEEGRGLLPEITYIDSLPEQGQFDLIHSASALQYIEDWRGVVRLLCSYRAKTILLSDVFAGDVPGFVTLQNYYGSRIPHWILNINELLEFLASLNYKLVMRTYVSSRRLDVEDTLPMDNFPESHRLEQTQHLLFQFAS